MMSKQRRFTALMLTLALLCALLLPAGAANATPKLTYSLSGKSATLKLEDLGQESIYGVQLELTLAGSFSSATFSPASSAAYAPPCHLTATEESSLVTVYLTANAPLNQGASLSMGTLTMPDSFTMPTTAAVILLGRDLRPLADGVVIPVSKQTSNSGGSSGGGGGSLNPGGSTNSGETTPPPAGETKPSSLPFEDVSERAWYFEAVDYVYRQGLMNGTAGNAFTPEGTTSRAMVVTILYRLAGSPTAPAPDFPDVAPEMYYTPAVGWGAYFGVVMGHDTGLFLPDAPITREQMATILYRYAWRMGYDVSVRGDLDVFPDRADISDYAVDAMAWAVGAGLVSGMGDGTVAPRGQTTRAQAATLLTRFCQNVAGA